MPQKVLLSVTIEKDVLKAVKKMAEMDNRNLSNYVETVLLSLAKRKGVIKTKKKK